MSTDTRLAPRAIKGDPSNDGWVMTTVDGVSEWAAPTGGGGSGIPDTIIDAKGDLIVGTAADTPARLPVGADGEVLVADSGEAGGMKWEAAGSSVKTAVFRVTGLLAVGVGKAKLRNNTGATWTLLNVQADVDTAGVGASVIVDLNKNGTTVFTTQANRPTITTGNTASSKVTAIDVTTVADGDYLTVDIDAIANPAAGLTVTVVYQ